MKRFVLTGAPGAGKTAILRQLELNGYGVVEEAATDVIALTQASGIAEPWIQPSFIDAITDLQMLRQIRASNGQEEIQFHDRCAICTAALARYLGCSISAKLSDEIERIGRESIFQRSVFFIRNLGFITKTEARRISLEETLRFEQIHLETYRSYGFEIVSIEAGALADRVAAVEAIAHAVSGK
jgi:predicted ATPase